MLHYIEPVLRNNKKIVCCPVTTLNEETDRWKNTLIGNFLGCRPNYSYVKEITSKIWKLKGGVEVSLLDASLSSVLPVKRISFMF